MEPFGDQTKSTYTVRLSPFGGRPAHCLLSFFEPALAPIGPGSAVSAFVGRRREAKRPLMQDGFILRSGVDQRLVPSRFSRD